MIVHIVRLYSGDTDNFKGEISPWMTLKVTSVTEENVTAVRKMLDKDKQMIYQQIEEA